MPIQVERATNAILHEVGQSGLSKGITPLEVVELAYTRLCSAHEGWYWALKTVRLDAVEGETIIRLPADWHNVYQPAQWDAKLRVLRDAEFYQLQESGVASANNWYLARLAEDDNGWYLEFMEALDVTEAEKFRVTYESGPVEITDGSQTLPLPLRMHPLFLAMCRAVAKGYEESDSTSVEQELARVFRSETFNDAVMADIRMRPPSIDRGAQRVRRIGGLDFLGSAVLPVISPDGTEIWPS